VSDVAKHRLPDGSAELDEPESVGRTGLSVRVLVFLAVATTLFISAVVWALTSTSDGLRAPVAADLPVPSTVAASPVDPQSPLPSASPSANPSASPRPSRSARARSSPSPTPKASTLTARFGMFRLSANSYIGSYTITNVGSTTVGAWTLVVTFPSGTTVNGFSGGAVQSGRTVTWSSRGSSVPPGRSTAVLFQVSWSGSGTGLPQSCAINGARC
jgi:hypothetical protein